MKLTTAKLKSIAYDYQNKKANPKKALKYYKKALKVYPKELKGGFDYKGLKKTIKDLEGGL